MKYWKAGIIFLIAFLIQPSLLNMINIAGYTPNLLLCLVVIFSFIYEDEMYGVVYGAAFGVLYDVCYSQVIGPTPIALTVVAICIILAREYANIENIINMWIVSIISFIAYYLMNWGLHRIAGNPIGIVYVFGKVPWIILYSMVVITIIYLILIRKVVKHHRDRYFR
ncbi:MAG: rod shape-determining protein MreD [Firmicutes bacterium]|jgi:rod shape-determining protein MreD|nr:rod shape-determining protein MreD [Bacillota bacterium]